MRLRNLLAIVAVLASLVALGCWDNRQEMARVLDQGYATSAQIVAAQFQRTAPFAIDGWRPRFVEQALSVDLQWQGQDGKTHVFRKVPVSERFERSIVNGDQLRLIAVPVKALDDDSSAPVLTLDAAARLESLKAWLGGSGALALAGWLGVAAMTLLRRRAPAQAAASAVAAQRPVEIPMQRILIGLMAFAVGAFLVYNAAALGAPADDGAKSVDVMAEITAVAGPPYTVRLGWRDGQGGVHHFGAAADQRGVLEPDHPGRKARSPRNPGTGPSRRRHGPPGILDDAPGERWQTKAVAGGIVLLLVERAVFVGRAHDCGAGR